MRAFGSALALALQSISTFASAETGMADLVATSFSDTCIHRPYDFLRADLSPPQTPMVLKARPELADSFLYADRLVGAVWSYEVMGVEHFVAVQVRREGNILLGYCRVLNPFSLPPGELKDALLDQIMAPEVTRETVEGDKYHLDARGLWNGKGIMLYAVVDLSGEPFLLLESARLVAKVE